MQNLYRAFVVEASGRMGPSALSYFMNKLVSMKGPYIAKSFLMNIEFSMARAHGCTGERASERANGRMILEYRRGHKTGPTSTACTSTGNDLVCIKTGDAYTNDRNMYGDPAVLVSSS